MIDDWTTRLTRTLECFASIRNILFAHTRPRLFVAGADGAMKIWDLHAAEPVASFQIRGGSPTAICLSPDDRRLFTGDRNGKVTIRSLVDSKNQSSRVLEFELAALREHTGEIQSLRLTADGSALIAAGGIEGERGTITLWGAPPTQSGR